MWKYFFGLFLGIQIGKEKKVIYKNRYIDRPITLDGKEILKNHQMKYILNK
jgi:hypothetical protein